MTVSTPICEHLSAVVKYFASSKMVIFFSRHYGGETSNSPVLGWLVGIKLHFYQGFPPIWLFNDCLYTYLCLFSRPLRIIPRRIKWFDFSVGTMEVKHLTHRYSEGRLASGPMFIRGLPLYCYFMALYTPCFAYFIARCAMFRVE